MRLLWLVHKSGELHQLHVCQVMGQIDQLFNQFLISASFHNYLFICSTTFFIWFHRCINKFTSCHSYLSEQIKYIILQRYKNSLFPASYLYPQKILEPSKIFNFKIFCQFSYEQVSIISSTYTIRAVTHLHDQMFNKQSMIPFP